MAGFPKGHFESWACRWCGKRFQDHKEGTKHCEIAHPVSLGRFREEQEERLSRSGTRRLGAKREEDERIEDELLVMWGK